MTEHTHNLTYHTSMTAMLLLLIVVTRLFCSWFALRTQIHLPFALTIGNLLEGLGPRVQHSHGTSIPNGKFAPGLPNTN